MASVTLNPSAYVSYGATSGNASISNQTTPVGKGSSNTTYATLTTSTSTGSTSYAFWKFDCSSIPSTATIDSVSCTAKCYVSSTTNISTRSVQLYNGTTTAKGSSTTFSNSTTATQTLTCGTWTRDELDNIHIRVAGTRGNRANSATIRFYGADLTITYTEAKVQYTVTISSTGNGTTSPTGTQTIEEGDSLDITLTPNAADMTIGITDNGTDVSNALTTVGTNYKYALSNISANHTINIVYTLAVKYAVNTTITNGTLHNPAESVEVVSGSDLEFSFSGNANTKYVGMTVNGSPVSATKVNGQNSTQATWSVSTNYSTYQTYAITNVNSDTSSYFWSAEAQSDGKYVLFTFNKFINLTGAEFYSSNSTDYPHSCNKLQVSANGTSWTDVGTFTDAQTSTFSSLNAQKIKYVRIYCDGTGVSNWLVLNTATFTYTTPEIVAGYSYTISNITEDTTVVITFASNNKITIKISGSYKAGTGYKKVGGTWTTVTPKEMAEYLKDKKIKHNI